MSIESRKKSGVTRRSFGLGLLAALAASTLQKPNRVEAQMSETLDPEIKKRADAFAKVREDFNKLSVKCESVIVSEEKMRHDVSVLKSVEVKIEKLRAILESVDSFQGLVVKSLFENFDFTEPFYFGLMQERVGSLSEKEFSREFYDFLITLDALSKEDQGTKDGNLPVVKYKDTMFGEKFYEITNGIGEIVTDLDTVHDKGSSGFIATMSKFYAMLTGGNYKYVPKCLV